MVKTWDWLCDNDLHNLFSRGEISLLAFQQIAYSRFELKIVLATLFVIQTGLAVAFGAIYG